MGCPVRSCRFPSVRPDTHVCVLHDFSEFGEFTGFRLNLGKTKALVQRLGPWPARLAGIQVVPFVKYLGALFGDVTPEEAYEKSVCTFQSRCLHISRMPLSSKERVQLVHTWCYPVLQVTGVAFYPLQSVLVRLRAAQRVAFGSRNWKLALDILQVLVLSADSKEQPGSINSSGP